MNNQFSDQIAKNGPAQSKLFRGLLCVLPADKRHGKAGDGDLCIHRFETFGVDAFMVSYRKFDDRRHG
jgi:hypothetical protein